MKSVIGILAHPPYTHVENKFNQISCNYTNSVYDAGGLPFIIPQIDDPALIQEYAEQIDGLLIMIKKAAYDAGNKKTSSWYLQRRTDHECILWWYIVAGSVKS